MMGKQAELLIKDVDDDKRMALVNDLDGLRDLAMMEDAIAAMSEQYLSLSVNGVDDKKGYELVHNARMEVTKRRTSIESKRVELKAPSIAYGRKCDELAKHLTGLLVPIEGYLKSQEKIVEDERARIKRENELKIQRELDRRVAELAKCGFSMPVEELRNMEPSYFDRILKDQQDAKAERDRVAQEERDRLDRERIELEEKRREIEASPPVVNVVTRPYQPPTDVVAAGALGVAESTVAISSDPPKSVNDKIREIAAVVSGLIADVPEGFKHRDQAVYVLTTAADCLLTLTDE